MWTELILPAVAAAIGYWLRTKGPLLGGSPTPPTPPVAPAPVSPVAPTQPPSPLLQGVNLLDGVDAADVLALLGNLAARRRQKRASETLAEALAESEGKK